MKDGSVASQRADTLSFAALVLNNLIQVSQPKKIVFSGYGLREGLFHELLSEEMRDKDALISACEGFANRSGRFSIYGEEIAFWLASLFVGETKNFYRILHAGALLSDIGWTEHPDYRAIHSFIRVLRLPIAGISHRQRIMLALIVYARYNGKQKQYEVQQVRDLLEKKDQREAYKVGLALRFAHLISGGVPGVLSSIYLKVADEKLVLIIEGNNKDLLSKSLEKVFYNLCNTFGLVGKIS